MIRILDTSSGNEVAFLGGCPLKKKKKTQHNLSGGIQSTEQVQFGRMGKMPHKGHGAEILQACPMGGGASQWNRNLLGGSYLLVVLGTPGYLLGRA